MKPKLKYVIFRTKWGCFGLLGTEKGLLRSSLPRRGRAGAEAVKRYLLMDLAGVERDGRLYKELQERIRAYFEGENVSFSRDIPVVLGSFSAFQRRALQACRRIGYGERVSYSGLARRLGQPGAARAVGNALAKNPVPLIIPCHRVIRNDGRIGGFSAIGGAAMKKKLLNLERKET